MKRRILAIGLVLFLIAVLVGCGSATQDRATGLPTPADADGVALTVTSQPVTIQVNTSGSTGLSGVAVSYLDGYWKGLGTTNSGGTVNANLPSGTWQFKAEYGGTSTQHTQNITSNPTVTFYTSEAKVVVKKHDNNPLSGVAISYMAGYYRGIGNTDGTGTASAQVFPGTYTFKAEYGGTSATQSVAIAGDGQTAGQSTTATFYTSEAKVVVKKHDNNPLSGVAISYMAGYYRGIGNTDGTGTASTQVFPGTYTFKADYGGTSATQDVAVPGDGKTAAQTITATFYTSEAQIIVKKSDTNPLSGVAVSYLAGYYRGIGNTDGTGTASTQVFPGTYTFKADYGGTSATQDVAVPGDGKTAAQTITATFYTSEAKIIVKLCDNTPVPGAAISYLAGYYRGIGNTDGTGTASTQVFPGTYTFKADYGGTSATQDVAVPGDGKTAAQTITATFNPTKVTLYYAGTKQYFAGYWRGFTSTVVLFPGTYSFKFDSYQTNIAVSSCSMSKVVNTLILKDHNGNPLSGGTARGGFGSNYGTWFVSGSTDANGLLLDIHDVGSQPTNMSYEMRYNNTVQVKTQDVSVNSVFQFQTVLLTLRLETCGGTPLNGGNPRYGAGSTYTTYWFPGGVTGSSAPGETAAEFFPGTYSFEMLYQATAEAKVSVVIPNANTKLTWQTTKVTLQYSGQISYGGGTGDSTWFNKPSMELLPGTYKFDFRNAGRMDLTFSKCEFTGSAFALKLINSGGSGIAGGTGQYYDGGWQSIPGSTGSDGILLHAVPGLKNTLSFRMTHAGASQEKSQNIATNSIVVFQTKLVTFKLLNSTNAETTGAGTQYYAGGWNTFGGGTTTATMELLPVNYSFRVSYAGASQEKSQNIATNATVVFQTGLVTMKLLDSGGATELSAGAEYYAGGWKTFDTGTTTTTMELLPVSYSFRVSYAGASQEKSQNIAGNSTVVFQTTLATMQLLDSSNNELAGGAQYYGGGWKTFDTGTTTTTMELLPVSYSFRVSYAGASQEKSQNIAGNSTVVFQTTLVKMKLLDSAGTAELNAGAQYYAGGWKTFGSSDTTATMELLPVSYSFRVSYGGASQEKSQNAATNATVVFQTGQVHSDSGKCTQYYAGGWKAFTQDMELLPVSYAFRFSDGFPETPYTIVAATTNPIH